MEIQVITKNLVLLENIDINIGDDNNYDTKDSSSVRMESDNEYLDKESNYSDDLMISVMRSFNEILSNKICIRKELVNHANRL